MSLLARLALIGLILAGCASGASPSTSPAPPETSGGPASPTPETSPEDPLKAFEAALVAGGATVRETGAFSSDPIGGQGAGLCVAGQSMNVYVFPTIEQRQAAAVRIDPNDPSKIANAIVEWSGNPKFWQAGRLIVLYLGSDASVEAGLTGLLGQPFARGQGRGPGLVPLSC